MLTTFFTVSQGRAAALHSAGKPAPQPVKATALVDTGASCTCVDPAVVSALGLQPTGSSQVVTPTTGTTPHNASVYDVGLFITGAQGSTPLHFSTIPVVTASLLAPQGFHALIGRDILGKCLVTYNGTAGFFTFAY